MYDYIFIVFLISTITAYGLFTPRLSPIDPAYATTCNENLVNARYCDITCKVYGFCYQNSAKDYVFIPLENCTNYCTNTGCSDTPDQDSCIPNSGRIGCSAEGIYPDPFDCRRSLHCSPGTAVSTCTDCGDRYYNSKTGVCEEVLEHGQCPSPVLNICPSVGFTTALPDDNRFYYTCFLDGDNLVPQMSKCSEGKYFDTSSKTCLSNGNRYYGGTEEICTASTTSSSTTNAITSSSTFSPMCQEEGTIPDPSDCHKYYICDVNHNSKHMICLPSHYFDTNLKKCVFGECSN